MKPPSNIILFIGLLSAVPAFAACGGNEAVYLGSQSQFEDAAQTSKSASQQAIQADTTPGVSNPAGKSTQRMQAAQVAQSVAYDRAQGQSNLINDLANDNYDPYYGYGNSYRTNNVRNNRQVTITNPQKIKAPSKKKAAVTRPLRSSQ